MAEDDANKMEYDFVSLLIENDCKASAAAEPARCLTM